MIELVFRRKQNPEPMKPADVFRQLPQPVAREIQNLKGVGEVENLPWELGEAAPEIKSLDAGEFPGTKLGESMHASPRHTVAASAVQQLRSAICGTHLEAAKSDPRSRRRQKRLRFVSLAFTKAWGIGFADGRLVFFDQGLTGAKAGV
jgi:hypothetical protein